MHLDFSTLFWAMGAVTEVAGLLLLFSWLQDRRSTSLAYWGAAYSTMALGGLVFAGDHSMPAKNRLLVWSKPAPATI